MSLKLGTSLWKTRHVALFLEDRGSQQMKKKPLKAPIYEISAALFEVGPGGLSTGHRIRSVEPKQLAGSSGDGTEGPKRITDGY
jgi:hypothetical protein